MELESILPVKGLRMSGKPERPYVSSLKSHPARDAIEARRKPLRTYGKRTASSESTEPVTKRRRIDGPSTCKTSHSLPIESTPSSDPIHPTRGGALPASPASLPLPKKGTITAYFGKAVPRAEVVTSSSPEPSSEFAGPSTPPSSPPIVSRKRKSRRLTTRVSKQRNDESAREVEEGIETGKENNSTIERKVYDDVHSAVLSQSTPHTLNQAENLAPRYWSEGGERGKSTQQQSRKTMSVQTTLSLSLTEKGYTECKECDMLYNPLHEADVRHHARRHAALLRAKSRVKDHRNID